MDLTGGLSPSLFRGSWANVLNVRLRHWHVQSQLILYGVYFKPCLRSQSKKRRNDPSPSHGSRLSVETPRTISISLLLPNIPLHVSSGSHRANVTVVCYFRQLRAFGSAIKVVASYNYKLSHLGVLERKKEYMTYVYI